MTIGAILLIFCAILSGYFAWGLTLYRYGSTAHGLTIFTRSALVTVSLACVYGALCIAGIL